MTNAEVLAHDLSHAEEDEEFECLVDFIECPSSDDCEYDGSDRTPCRDCKIKWLRSEWED